VIIIFLFYRTGDISLVWRFSGDILKKDEVVGARIFTELFRTSITIKPGVVVEYLTNYPLSLRIFLEFLIAEKKDDDEAVHNQLAMMYIDDLNRLDSPRNSPGYRATVNKLRSLLRTSQRLNLSRLSDTLNKQRFPHEYAIVCGRLGHHSSAIEIFINQLKVFCY